MTREGTEIYRNELHREFQRVMLNDAVAVYGYDTAASYGLGQVWKLQAAIVALSNANRRLSDKLSYAYRDTPDPGEEA